MDRFIVLIRKSNKVDYKYLKSNMDRFIGKSAFGAVGSFVGFKIQYG